MIRSLILLPLVLGVATAECDICLGKVVDTNKAADINDDRFIEITAELSEDIMNSGLAFTCGTVSCQRLCPMF